MAKRPRTPLEPVDLAEDVAAQFEVEIDTAERELSEMRVNLRWGKAQVATLKRAAALYGVPYQTYLKEAAMRQAINDLRAAAEARVGPGRATSAPVATPKPTEF
jgi:predicted DNA binding CopG/RHH family protein